MPKKGRAGGNVILSHLNGDSVFSESPFCQERHAPLLASGFWLTGNDKSTSLQSTVFWITVSLRRETPVSKEFSTWVNKTFILPLQLEGPNVRGWCCRWHPCSSSSRTWWTFEWGQLCLSLASFFFFFFFFTSSHFLKVSYFLKFQSFFFHYP